MSPPIIPDEFMEWFRKNYPGPDTIIHKPDWHATRVYQAAIHASRAEAAEAERAHANDCADAAIAGQKAAEAERDDAIDTLNAWFDRRELAHDAIDETVLNAARGYLRTSRSGGLDQETSAVIEGVIEDMARLSVFADLFARAFLARHQKGTDT